MSDTVWATSTGEYFMYASLTELLSEAWEPEVGMEVEFGTTSPVVPSDLIGADDVMDMIGERAYDVVSEFNEDYPDVSKEAREELETLLHDWIRKHAPINFYHVKNVQKYIVTAEDLKEMLDYLHSVQ